MPAIVFLVPDGDHYAGWLPRLDDRHDLILLGLSEIGVKEFIATVFRRLQNGSTPFLRPVHDPVLELLGDFAKHVAAHRVDMPVRIEKTNHSLWLLERLDQSVQKKPIKASIAELNAILVVLGKGVHGNLQCGQIPGAYSRERHSASRLLNTKLGYQGRSPWLVRPCMLQEHCKMKAERCPPRATTSRLLGAATRAYRLLSSISTRRSAIYPPQP